jgi:hypothetical protein
MSYIDDEFKIGVDEEDDVDEEFGDSIGEDENFLNDELELDDTEEY